MNTSPATHEAGFSLVETLVALFVVALLATTGGSLLISSVRAGERIDGAMDSVRDLTVMHAMLRDDFAAMTRRTSLAPNAYGAPVGPIGTAGDGDGVLTSFVRGGWALPIGEAPVLRSDLLRIEYVLEDEQLVRRGYLAPDPTATTPVVTRILARNVARTQLRYRNGGTWANTWMTGMVGPQGDIPDAVEISIEFTNGDTIVQKFATGDAGA